MGSPTESLAARGRAFAAFGHVRRRLSLANRAPEVLLAHAKAWVRDRNLSIRHPLHAGASAAHCALFVARKVRTPLAWQAANACANALAVELARFELGREIARVLEGQVSDG